MNTQKLKNAWIFRWCAHGDEERILKEHNLTNKIFDFLSGRHDLDNYVREYTENIYKKEMLSMSEKFSVAHYNHVKARKRLFGSTIPVFTHYDSGYYRDLMKCHKENVNISNCRDLLEKWKKYPEYITIGHNPSIEAKKVFNLELKIENGEARLKWEEIFPDGSVEEFYQNTTDLFNNNTTCLEMK